MAQTLEQLDGVNILLGVTGGIAAYKAADLASKLTGAGALVDCVLTKSACELIRPRTFQAVTGRDVYTNLWDEPGQYNIKHISLADRADVVVVAPATANIIAKMAAGICDDLLSTVLCAAWAKPTVIAPAMNNNMWTNPAVAANIQTLTVRSSVCMIGPETGRLACGTEAIGRMSEPGDILGKVAEVAKQAR